MGRNRLKAMLEGRPDWCISRQRDWGVPIAFLEIKNWWDCFWWKSFKLYSYDFEQKGCDAWYDLEISEFYIQEVD